MNTTYVSKLNPQFENTGVQDVTADLSLAKAGFDMMIKENENELKTLRNIAQDQAEIEFNKGSVELVKQFGADFKGLDEALGKLSNDLYQKMKPTYPDLAEDMLRKHSLVRDRAVDHAHNTYIKDNNKKIRDTSGLLLDGLESAAANDWMIYVGEISTKNPDERRPEMITPFLNDLEQHGAILTRRDMEGNPIFTDSQVASRKGMKGVRMQGTYDYINGLELDDLKQWYENTLQSEQFRKDTGFNYDDIEKLAKKAKSRIKELEKDEEHNIKVRQVQETVNLLNNAGDMTAIEQLKAQKVVPEELIDSVVEASNKNIEENWYDPNKSSDPFGMLKLYSELGSLVENKDYSPEASMDKLKKTVDIMNKTHDMKKELNLDDEIYREYQEDMKKAILDESFGIKLEKVSNYAKDLGFGERLIQYSLKFIDRVLPWMGPKREREKENATTRAKVYANSKMPEIMMALRWDNNDVFERLMNDTRYEAVKIANSYWINPDEFDKLEEDLKNGKEAIYISNGVPLKYNGIKANKALFEIKI